MVQRLASFPMPCGASFGSLAKLFFFLYTYVWIRGTLPRIRYDQLMDIGWKYLIPLSLGWLLLVAAAQVKPLYALFTLAGLCLGISVLYVAMGVAQERAEETEEDDFGTASDVEPPEGANV